MNKHEKIESILDHTVKNEDDFLTNPRQWKTIALNNFNKVHRGELGLMEVVHEILDQGVELNGVNDTIASYRIKEFMEHIAKVSDIEDFDPKMTRYSDDWFKDNKEFKRKWKNREYD